MKREPFRRPVVVWLGAVAACSLALTVAFLLVPPAGGPVTSPGADAFSRSALGHHAFVALLRATGVPVVVSRYASAERAGSIALLLTAEPRLQDEDASRQRRLTAMLERAQNALLVLPKWSGEDHPRAPGWIRSAELLPESGVDRVLHAAVIEAHVFRSGGAGLQRCQDGITVTGRSLQFLAVSASFQPLIRCDGGGVLLAEVRRADGRRLLVLSDPDLISNHGLGQGDNAAVALEVVGRARQAGQAVVLDETLHGYERIPSLWRELFAFPLLPSVLQGAFALGALVWSGLARFGTPVPTPTGLGSGRTVLIENTASLLRSAGYSAHTLGRYLDAAVEDVGRALHAPSTRQAEQRTWLERIARFRGVRIELSRLQAEVDATRRADRPSAAAIVAAARRIHRWKQEMLLGPPDRPRH